MNFLCKSQRLPQSEKSRCSNLLTVKIFSYTLFLCAVTTFFVSVASASDRVSIDPAKPLVNVPFRVHLPSLTPNSGVFIASTSDCKAVDSVSTICSLPNDFTCEFIVTAALLGISAQYEKEVPPVYICSGVKSQNPLQTLYLSIIDVIPRFGFAGTTPFSIKIGNAVPVGSIIGFFSDDACMNATYGMSSVTLGNEREISVQVAFSCVLRVCARVPYGDINDRQMTSFVPAATLLVGEPFSVNPTDVFRHTNPTFLLSPFTQFPYASFSISSLCEPLSQNPVQGNTLQNVMIHINVTRGLYRLCTGLPYYQSSRVYLPSSNFVNVLEYGIQPHTMYTNAATTIKLTLDAAPKHSDSSMETALFRNSDCSGTAVIAWSTLRKWTVGTVGEYYACVREDSTGKNVALAKKIKVLTAPTVSFSQNPIISGLTTTVTLTGRFLIGVGIITVGLSTESNCSTPMFSGNTTVTGSTTTIRVPQNSLRTLFLCISTPSPIQSPGDGEEIDFGYTYNRGTIQVRSYVLNYLPIFVGKSSEIILDPEIQFDSDTKGFFSKNECIDHYGPEFSMNVLKLEHVIFNDTGVFTLCVIESNAFSTAANKESSFVLIGNIMVYDHSLLSPNSIIPGVTVNVTVSKIPPNAPVHFVTSDNCNSPALAAGNADVQGVAKVTLSHATEANLTLCIGYYGSGTNEEDLVFSPNGKLNVEHANSFPSAVIKGKVNRVNFVVSDKAGLNGFHAFFMSGVSVSCGAAAETASLLNLTIPGKGTAFTQWTPADSGTWTVCVGKKSSTFVRGGEVEVVEPLVVTSKPTTGVVGLSFKMQFSGASFAKLHPTQFFVTQSVGSCADVDLNEPPPMYGNGEVNSINGETNTFVVTQAGKLVVCVGWKYAENEFFVYGGEVEIKKFTAVSHYAFRGLTNDLVAFPLLEGASVFLVLCSETSTCETPISPTVCKNADERYYTSAVFPLVNAKVGMHVLCQEDILGKTVGSNSLISVVDSFVATFQDAEVRQFKPTTLVFSGGDMNSRSENFTVIVTPSNVKCGTANELNEEFGFPSGTTQGNITVTHIMPFAAEVRLCLRVSPNEVVVAAVFNLLSYMTPGTFIANRLMRVKSGRWKENVLAKLTASTSCSGNVMDRGPVIIMDGISELQVDGCSPSNAALTAVFYCESRDGGRTYTFNGKMSLLRLTGCAAGSQAAIKPVTAAPQSPINDYGVDTDFLTNMKLSETSDCKSIININDGYLPQFDEIAKFFVCVSTKGDPGYMFTTDTPTLSIANFVTSPSSVPTQFTASTNAYIVRLKLNYPTGTQHTFLSDTSNCIREVAGLPGLSADPPQASITLTGVSGIMYVCVDTNNNGREVTAVSLFLSFYAPIVTNKDPALVRGAPFRATLQVPILHAQQPLYSLTPGADDTYEMSSLYVSKFRGVFLSRDNCQSIVVGTEVVYVDRTGRIQIPTTNIALGVTRLSLCCGTPGGNVSVIEGVPISTDIIFPSQFVLGVDVEVFIPLSPDGVFHLRQDAHCGGEDIVSSFTTRSDGRGKLSFKPISGDVLPPAGKWTLCKRSTQFLSGFSVLAAELDESLVPLTTIEASNPVHYDIRGRHVILNTPSTIFLLDDLIVSRLLPGFSTNSECTERGDSFGTWRNGGNEDPTVSKSIIIESKKLINNIFLCAVTTVNNSIVSVPQSGAIHFLASDVVIPSIVSQCSSTPLNTCTPPGSTPSAYFSVIKGSCCNLSDRSNEVGRVSRNSKDSCQFEMNSARLSEYPSGTSFTVCAWDSSYSYCPTFGYLMVDDEVCNDAFVKGHEMDRNTAIALIVCCTIIVLLLLIIVFAVIVECVRRKRDLKQIVFAAPLRADGELNPFVTHTVSLGDTSGCTAPLFYAQSRPPSTAFVRDVSLPSGGYLLSAPGGTPSSDAPTETRRQVLWEGIENDERDQIALWEARDRYSLRIAFMETLERLRVAQKERELQDEFTDEEYTFSGLRSGAFLRGQHASAPSEKICDKGTAAMVYGGIFCNELQVSRSLSVLESAESSTNSLSVTTTQRFYDGFKVTMQCENARRQRITNWESEERNSIVNTEFNNYVQLQHSSLVPRVSTSSAPFAVFIEDDENNDEHDIKDDVKSQSVEVDDIYDAPPLSFSVDKYGEHKEYSGEAPHQPFVTALPRGVTSSFCPLPLPVLSPLIHRHHSEYRDPTDKVHPVLK